MARRPRRRRKVISVPVASMGDIAFLLIIFFMITSSFAREQSIRMTPPKAPDLLEIQNVPVSVSIDEEGKIYLLDAETDIQGVEYGVAALLKDVEDDARKIVRFRCDSKIQKEIFEPVLNAITKGGGIVAAVGELTEP